MPDESLRTATHRRMLLFMIKSWPLFLACALAMASAVSCGSGETAGSRFSTGGDASTGGVPPSLVLGGGGDGGSGVAPQSLSFMPAAGTIIVTGAGPQTASYSLIATDSSGHTSMVTADSVAFDRPDLATVSDAEPVVATAPPTGATSFYGGTGTIHAIYHGKEATATVTVQVHLTDYGAGLDATNPGVMALSGANFMVDPAPGITPILYPYDKTVWPLGLTSPLLMWNAPEMGDIYRLSYSEKNYTFDGYYTLASLPAQMRLDQTVWDRMTASNDAANGPDPLTFTLYRYDNIPATAYLTSTETWTIAPESLQGAIYY